MFAEVIAEKLFKKGSASSLKDHLKNLLIEKSPVRYRGVITNINVVNDLPRPGERSGGTSSTPPRASIPEVMDDLRNVFQITDEEALLINAVIDEVMKDESIVNLIIDNADNNLFLEAYSTILKQRVINYYLDHNWDERLIEGPYVSPEELSNLLCRR